MADTYRTRIYSRYVTARTVPLAPVTLDGLTLRAPMLWRLVTQYFPADRQAAITDLDCGHGPSPISPAKRRAM